MATAFCSAGNKMHSEKHELIFLLTGRGDVNIASTCFAYLEAPFISAEFSAITEACSFSSCKRNHSIHWSIAPSVFYVTTMEIWLQISFFFRSTMNVFSHLFLPETKSFFKRQVLFFKQNRNWISVVLLNHVENNCHVVACSFLLNLIKQACGLRFGFNVYTVYLMCICKRI